MAKGFQSGGSFLPNEPANFTNTDLACNFVKNPTIGGSSTAAGSAVVVDTTSTQTLTNKTLTSPTINTPSITGGSSVETVNASGGATVQLTSAQSGQTFLFDAATGITYTLPAAAAGLNYVFVVTVSCTSNAHKVITKNTGTEFVQGIVAIAPDATTPSSTAGPKFFAGNGSSHVAVTQAAASTNSTGGIKGSTFMITCLSTTLWNVSEAVIEAGSGATVATPFTTS